MVPKWAFVHTPGSSRAPTLLPERLGEKAMNTVAAEEGSQPCSQKNDIREGGAR